MNGIKSKAFKVALSYPSEHREFVEVVAMGLAEVYGKANVLFDQFHRADFAHPQLMSPGELPHAYRRAELAVVFLCEEYDKKPNCMKEFRQILTIGDNRRIMFVRLEGYRSRLPLPEDGSYDIEKLNEKEAKTLIEEITARINRQWTKDLTDKDKIVLICPVTDELETIKNIVAEKLRLKFQGKGITLVTAEEFVERFAESAKQVIALVRLFGSAKVESGIEEFLEAETGQKTNWIEWRPTNLARHQINDLEFETSVFSDSVFCEPPTEFVDSVVRRVDRLLVKEDFSLRAAKFNKQQLANPFVGLRSFDVSDQPIFFGREVEVQEMMAQLRSSGFVAVLGDSGFGKSSLVRAGLIPEITSDGSWLPIILRPGVDPIETLKSEFWSVLKSIDESLTELDYEVYCQNIRQGKIANVIRALTQKTKILLVIDQFEELIRLKLTSNSESVASFEDNLSNLIGMNEATSFLTVLTIRSDFLGKCNLFSQLGSLISENVYIVPRLDREKIINMISGPIRSWCVANDLPFDELNLSAKGASFLSQFDMANDELPRLQYHLHQADWSKTRLESQIDRLLPSNSQNLSDKIDQVGSSYLSKLNKEQKQTCKELICTIVEHVGGELLRRPRTIQQIAEELGKSGSDVARIVTGLCAVDFLELRTNDTHSLERQELVDLTHECVVRRWNVCKEWFEEEEKNKRYYSSVSVSLQNRIPFNYDSYRTLKTWEKRHGKSVAWKNRHESGSVELVKRFAEKYEDERDEDNWYSKAQTVLSDGLDFILPPLRTGLQAAPLGLLIVATCIAIWGWYRATTSSFQNSAIEQKEQERNTSERYFDAIQTARSALKIGDFHGMNWILSDINEKGFGGDRSPLSNRPSEYLPSDFRGWEHFHLSSSLPKQMSGIKASPVFASPLSDVTIEYFSIDDEGDSDRASVSFNTWSKQDGNSSKPVQFFRGAGKPRENVLPLQDGRRVILRDRRNLKLLDQPINDVFEVLTSNRKFGNPDPSGSHLGYFSAGGDPETNLVVACRHVTDLSSSLVEAWDISNLTRQNGEAKRIASIDVTKLDLEMGEIPDLAERACVSKKDDYFAASLRLKNEGCVAAIWSLEEAKKGNLQPELCRRDAIPHIISNMQFCTRQIASQELTTLFTIEQYRDRKTYRDKSIICEWDTKDGRLLNEYSPPHRIEEIAVNHQGSLLVAGTNRRFGTQEGELFFWNLSHSPQHSSSDLTPDSSLRLVDEKINTLCFFPDGKRVFAQGGESGAWIVPTNYESKTPVRLKNDCTIHTLAMIPNRPTKLISGDSKGNILCWDLISGDKTKLIPKLNNSIRSLDLHPTEMKISVCEQNGRISVWDFGSGTNETDSSSSDRPAKLLQEFLNPGSDSVRFIGEGNLVAAFRSGYSRDRSSLSVWSVGSGELDVTFSRMDLQFANVGGAETTQLVFQDEEYDLARVGSSKSNVLDIKLNAFNRLSALSSNCRWLVVCDKSDFTDSEDIIRWWDLETCELVGKNRGASQASGTTKMIFIPENVEAKLTRQRIVTGSSNGLVKVWAPFGTQPLLELNAHGPVTALCFEPKNRRLICANSKGEIVIW